MTRFLTKLVAGSAVFVLAASPGLAAAQDSGVDENTGPVSFANAAAFKVGDEGQGGGSVISETQRSPLKAGSSKLSQDRAYVPKDEGEQKVLGPNYLLSLGKFDKQDDSPFPEGVRSRDHNVVAQLADTTVPSAIAETNYALRDYKRGGATVNNTVFAFQGAKTTADCAGNDKAVASVTAEKLWVRSATGGTLDEVPVPQGEAKVDRKNLPFGPSIDVEGADSTKTTSDLTISRLSSFDQLLKQSAWRGGDTTVAAGWQVEILSHVKNSKDELLRDVRTRIVLGGVSCSLPKGFVPKAPGGNTGGGQAPPADVPVKIPAGVTTIAAPAEDNGSSVLGFALVGGGVLLAGAALVLVRRRKPADPE